MDPISFTYESTPACWRCCYDPEGPQGFGKTKEAALIDLIDQCDEKIRTECLAGAIMAALGGGVKMSDTPRTDARAWDYSGLCRELERENAALRAWADRLADRAYNAVLRPNDRIDRDNLRFAVEQYRADSTLQTQDETPKRSFSDFIRNATPEEKAEVYGRVMDAACERQRETLQTRNAPTATTERWKAEAVAAQAELHRAGAETVVPFMDYDAMTRAFLAWMDALPAGIPGVRNPGGVWFDAFAAGAKWRGESLVACPSGWLKVGTEAPAEGEHVWIAGYGPKGNRFYSEAVWEHGEWLMFDQVADGYCHPCQYPTYWQRIEAIPERHSQGDLRKCGACDAESVPVEGEAFDGCPMCAAPWPRGRATEHEYIAKGRPSGWTFLPDVQMWEPPESLNQVRES